MKGVTRVGNAFHYLQQSGHLKISELADPAGHINFLTGACQGVTEGTAETRRLN